MDIKAAFRKVVPAGKHDLSAAELESKRSVWLETPPTPLLENKGERQLQWFLGQVEILLPGDGFCVGGRPSLADAYLFNILGETAEGLDPSSGEPFGSAEGVTKVLEAFPKLAAVVTTFKASPGMEMYLATRGPVGF